jgi:hypothetical protein
MAALWAIVGLEWIDSSPMFAAKNRCAASNFISGIKINAACTGFAATDLNNFQGTRTVEQAAREPERLALLDANGPTGTFSNEDGPLPW